MADDWSRDYWSPDDWSQMIGRGDDWSLGLLVARIIGGGTYWSSFFMCKNCVCYVDLSVADVRCLIVHRKKQVKERVDAQGTCTPCSDFPKYFMSYVARFARYLPKP